MSSRNCTLLSPVPCLSNDCDHISLGETRVNRIWKYLKFILSSYNHLIQLQCQTISHLQLQLIVQMLWSGGWSMRTYHPQNPTQASGSRSSEINTHALTSICRYFSHLSISKFSSLHSQGELNPFPAQRQYNWERKVTTASKKVQIHIIELWGWLYR